MGNFTSGVFPKQADNNYQGHMLTLWGFAMMALVTVGRSLIHIFKFDGGAQSIATIRKTLLVLW